jgi:Domain of unknown function DUF11
MGGKLRLVVVLAVAAGVLALPAAAQAASYDIGITQTASAKVVKPGGTVSFDITVSNVGTQSLDNVEADLASYGGGGSSVPNPYLSFSTSQGSCSEGGGYGPGYYAVACMLGTLAPGQSVQIAAAVQVNASMNHCVDILHDDSNNYNNHRCANVFLDAPPVVNGPKQLKIKGLPNGCVSGDFTLDVTAKVANVKKVKVSAFLGYNDNGNGQYFNKTAKGNHLKAKFPASQAVPDIEKTYDLKVKARVKGGKKLKTTITYTRC